MAGRAARPISRGAGGGPRKSHTRQRRGARKRDRDCREYRGASGLRSAGRRRRKTQAGRLAGESGPIRKTQIGRPGDPATRRPGDPATRRPGIIPGTSSQLVKPKPRERSSLAIPLRPSASRIVAPVARNASLAESIMVIAFASEPVARHTAQARRASPVPIPRTVSRTRKQGKTASATVTPRVRATDREHHRDARRSASATTPDCASPTSGSRRHSAGLCPVSRIAATTASRPSPRHRSWHARAPIRPERTGRGRNRFAPQGSATHDGGRAHCR